MTTTRFETLFTFRVVHDYFGGACHDFDFVPTEDSAALLRGARMVSKAANGQWSLLFQATTAGGAPAPLFVATGKRVRLGLRLNNAAFMNFTALPFDPRGRIAYLQNGSNASALDPLEALPLVGRTLAHTLTRPMRPALVELRDLLGRVLDQDEVSADADRSTVSFDLARSAPAPGLYVVRERYSADQPTDHRYYADAELAGRNIVAVLDIRIAETFYTAPPAFELAFGARADRLRYYLVVKNFTDAELASLTVADAGFTEDERPAITFDRVAPADFTAGDLPPALLADSGARILLFRSQGAVSRKARARRKIQLSRNGDVLVEDLPQPSASQTDSNFIVHVSKP